MSENVNLPSASVVVRATTWPARSIVTTTPETAIDQHRDFALHALHHLRQRLDGSADVVELARAVVGNQHARSAALDAQTRILGPHDALHQNRQLC